MRFWGYWDQRARQLGLPGLKLAQATSIFCVLVLVKLVPQILSVSVWWFAGLAVLCGVLLLCWVRICGPVSDAN